MKIKVLASGSKGNCTYIESDEAKILIDAGISATRLSNLLLEINIKPEEINAIVISHTHDDHIGFLQSLIKKTKAKVYITIDLFPEIRKKISIDDIEIIEDKYSINDMNITLLNTSHDVKSYGFLIENNNRSVVYITDTGYINRKLFDLTLNKDLYIIEANHNEEMLMNGPYPYYLKQRVIGDKGHLSNNYTGRYLNKTIGNNTKYIILAHISENNNNEELAYREVSTALAGNEFGNDKIRIAKQNKALDVIEI